MDERLKFLLEELVKQQEDVLDAFDIAGSEQVCGFTREKGEKLTALIEELCPYIDPIKHKHRVSNLLHFPYWKEAEIFISMILSESKMIDPEIEVGINGKLNINILKWTDLCFVHVPEDSLIVINSLITGEVNRYFNILRNKGLFNKDGYLGQFITDQTIVTMKLKLKEALRIMDYRREKSLIQMIADRLLVRYVPYNKYKAMEKRGVCFNEQK